MKRLAETAYLVAMYRALETERSQALFRDPFARRLAGGRGAMLVEMLGNLHQNRASIALRTVAIDQLLQQVIATQSIATVLNLAAGFDTRPYRLDLPATLRWIEVDLPEILFEKAKKLESERSRCQLERIQLDLTDPVERNRLFQQVEALQEPVLILTEGLLVYLSEAQVSELATDLANYPSFQWWLFELASSALLQVTATDQERFDQYFTDGQRSFVFAPERGTDFFQTYGWTVSEFRSVGQNLRQKNRIVYWLLQQFAKQRWNILEQSGFVLLRRRETNGETSS